MNKLEDLKLHDVFCYNWNEEDEDTLSLIGQVTEVTKEQITYNDVYCVENPDVIEDDMIVVFSDITEEFEFLRILTNVPPPIEVVRKEFPEYFV